MAYQSEYVSDTIGVILERVNRNYFLPAIQRQFVWEQDQILQLFDSIMRGYPISSFLFWEVKEDNREKWEIYKFIENYKKECSSNEVANVGSVQNLHLVLDGQQRLTALLVGLKGSYTVRRRFKRRAKADSWNQQFLYLDLFKDSKVEPEDEQMGLRFGFAFFEKPPSEDKNQYWFRVSDIMKYDGKEDEFYDYVQTVKTKLPDSATMGQSKILELNLNRLFRAFWQDRAISYYTERDQNYDRVLDIFVRANEGGTKLSKSDLLLSLITSKWGEINAREEIYGFVQRLNNELIKRNDFDKDFVMKTCLALADLPVRYKVENFTNQNLELIYGKWTSIKESIEAAVELINTFGIDRDTLTSANALIPIAYFLFKQDPHMLKSTTPASVKTIDSIRKWFLMALIGNVFGRAGDTVLAAARRAIQQSDGNDFPSDQIITETTSSSPTEWLTGSLDKVLDVAYGDKESFLALSLLYDETSWGRTNFNVDHIFPQTLFTDTALKKRNITGSARDKYKEMCHSLANLEILTWQENTEKLDKDFSKWIGTRDASFKTKHLIPDNQNLYSFEHLEEFLDAREQLIKIRLRQALSLPVPSPVSA